MIVDNIVSCARQEAMHHLRARLNGYRRYYTDVYIGVTADPERRWAKHTRQRGWRKMVLLYEAYTPEIAVELEQDLIAYARRCNFRIPVSNVGNGGEGVSSARRSNMLYVLVA